MVADRELLCKTLLAGPWRLDSDDARWLVSAGIGFLQILTLDQRHFRALHPLWGADYFTILPYDA